MRTQPMCTEISASGALAAEHELGRAAADIDDQKRPGREVETGGRAAERKPRLFLARESSGREPSARSAASKNAALFAASRAALVAAARTRAHAVLAMRAPYSDSTATVRAMASGCSAPVTSTP